MNGAESWIFDLSPAEKLELVEDLWDDLAGTPEAVPVHDWQKHELARRKATRAPAMAAELVIAPEAALDISEPMFGKRVTEWGWARSSLMRLMRRWSAFAGNPRSTLEFMTSTAGAISIRHLL